VIASLYIGSVMLLILNLPLAGLRVRSITIPQPLLYGGIQAIQLTHESFARAKRKMATRQTRSDEFGSTNRPRHGQGAEPGVPRRGCCDNVTIF